MMNNILHITPHLGGGVGTVLLNWLTYDKSNKHSIVSLDYANKQAVAICNDNNIELFSQISVNEILEKINPADIVVIHFWNHPLLYDFLIRNPLPVCRIIFWSHVAGTYPPYVFNKNLFNLCEKFVFSSLRSFEVVPESEKFLSILSTGGTERFLNLEKEGHKSFNIGYIGTIDYAKMNENYIEAISKTNADKIYITGDGKNINDFKNLNNRFVITGKVDNVGKILSKLDIFAYLLNPNHYGTGEQVLQEAMATGIVPVVLNNSCEINLVKHMKTGLVAKNLDEAINYINLLKDDIKLRNELSLSAKEYAKTHFSLNNLATDWNNLFNKVIKLPKTEKNWNINKDRLTSYDIFKESLGDYKNLFENKTEQELKELLQQSNWSSDTKGTPKQYYAFLGGDELEKLCNLYN